jgi:predicted lipoprotein with Yx(FWY)xxD motif
MHAIRSASYAIVIATMLTACSARDRTADTSSSAGAIETATASERLPAAAASGSVGTASAADLGRYLTDARGRALYMFERDTRNTSRCTEADGCAIAWPPFTLGTPTTTDTSVQAKMLGAISRTDARRQLTYDGMPLYYYEDDKKPGDIEGQGKLEFGGLWYVVSPSGRAIKAPRSAQH